MRRDISQPLLDLDGKPIVERDVPVTLMTVALSALMAQFEDERALTGKEKADRYQLAMKINKRPGEVDLTAEQVSLLKLLIGKAYGPLVVGQAYEMLEQEPKAIAKKEATN